MEKIDWKRWAAVLFCVAVGGVAVFLLVRYALPVFLPFLLAWGISLIVRPLSKKISQNLSISQKLCAALLLTMILGGTVLLVFGALKRLLQESERLLEQLFSDGGELAQIANGSWDLFDWLTAKVGFLRRLAAGERFAAFRERFRMVGTEMLTTVLERLSETLPNMIGKIVTGLPSFFFGTVVTVVAGFYFCMDGDRVSASLVRLAPKSVQRKIPAWKAHIRSFSWKYVRAYLLLLLITFVELFLGFCILRVEYAFLLALIIAFVDMLPVLGVGTVLIPWAVISLIQQSFYLGIGLLILYLVILLVRQVMEPRLVGGSLGLHPLLSLFATYLGWQWFGLFGMLLAPPVALLCKTLLSKTQR